MRQMLWNWSPDEGGSVGQSAPSGGDTSAPAPPASAESGGGVVTGGGATGTAPAPSPPALTSGTVAASAPVPGASFRDVLTKMGQADVAGQFQSDEALAHHYLQVRQEMQRAQQLAALGQQAQPHWSEFQKFKAEQEQAARLKVVQEQGKPWWSEYFKPPEYNPAWEKQILKDSQGNLVPAPGAPLDVVQKYNQYQAFRAEQVEKLVSNPFEYMAPAMQQLARAEAQRIVREQLAGVQAQQMASGFVEQNQGWLFQQVVGQDGKPTGQVQVDQAGRRVLSQDGQAFKYYVDQAQQMGVRDQGAMKDYALGMVQRDYALRTLQQQPAPGGVPAAAVAGEQAKQGFLNGAANRPNVTGSVQPPGGNGITPAQNQSLPLNERLRRSLKAAGVGDKDVA